MQPFPRQATTSEQLLRLALSLLVGFTMLSLLLPGAAQGAPSRQIPPGCVNLVENGGFEVIGPQWQIQSGPRPPMYTNEVTFDGSLQAMRVGNGSELSNLESVSEVRHIPLQFPPNATRIILRFRYLPRYDAAPGEDLQQADLYYYATNQLALPLLNVQENELNWKLVERDLTAYRGQLVSLRFRVRNDGLLGRTWMYVDNVEIEYCSQTPIPPTNTPMSTATATVPPTATPWPTPIPTWPTALPTWPPGTVWPTALPTWPPGTAWPTALPTWPPGTAWPTALPTWPPATAWPTLAPPLPGCMDIARNGSFEAHSDWHIGESPIPARYTNERVHTGARAMLLGNPPGAGPSVPTYSSIRQLVTIPYGVTGAQLRWWQLAFSQEPPSPFAGPHEDRQEVILLTPDLTVMGILSRLRSNDGIWEQRAVDLTPYRGQSFFIYFNVFNNPDPARTWLYLDDVEVFVCGAPGPVPYAMPPGSFDAPPPPEQAPLDAPFFEPAPTATPFVPTQTPIPPTDTPLALMEAPLVEPTATQPAPAVAILTTPTSGPGDATVQPRAPVAPPSTVSTTAAESWWRQSLGALAVMCSIPVLIGIIIVLIVQIRRMWRAPAVP